MSKYRKQFIVKTEEYINELYPLCSILEIREAYNPDMLDNMNRTYAHVSMYGGGLELLVLDWDDNFELVNKQIFD